MFIEIRFSDLIKTLTIRETFDCLVLEIEEFFYWMKLIVFFRFYKLVLKINFTQLILYICYIVWKLFE